MDQDTFLDRGGVRLIGRLGRLEALQNDELRVKKANRVGFEIDAFNGAAPLQAVSAAVDGDGDGADEVLAVLRVVTTRGRFQDMMGQEELAEGDWLLLDLEPRGKRSGPFAWAAPLTLGGYGDPRPFSVVGGRRLFREDDRPLRPLSAAVSGELALARSIADRCAFPVRAAWRASAAARRYARAVSQQRPHHAVVHDVGQASFATLRSANGADLVHLDAGWPISWNGKTAPKTKPKVSPATVVLSHWDWDHLHGYHTIPGLAASFWIAPVQRLGPGAKRVASQLSKAKRLIGVGNVTLRSGAYCLSRCSGPPGSSNHSGLALHATLASGKSLLFVGDADYDFAPAPMRSADFLVVTHHGANFSGGVPAPTQGQGSAVVSVGIGNGYGHPAKAALSRHTAAKWQLVFTCKWNGSARGQRVLGP